MGSWKHGVVYGKVLWCLIDDLLGESCKSWWEVVFMYSFSGCQPCMRG